jgi:NADH-quinone oxidoreductase subunit E
MIKERDEHGLIFTGFSGKAEELIPLLQAIQKRDGYISPEAVHQVAGFLRLSENTIYGVVSFYAQFRFRPPAKNLVRVCLGTACHVQGGSPLSAEIEKKLGIHSGETTPDGRFDFQEVACLGCCAQAPVVELNGKIYGKMTPAQVSQLLSDHAKL